MKYPDAIASKVRASGAARLNFDTTISALYDTPERYADAFRVVGKVVLTRHSGLPEADVQLRQHRSEQIASELPRPRVAAATTES